MPQAVPASGWQYNRERHRRSHLLPAGTPFVPNDIYEFSYTAKDPTVNGVGFAAVRDWNAWLRYEKKDDAGNANPLAGDITQDLHRSLLAARPLPERLPLSGIQSGGKRKAGLRRHDAVDRCGRWHQHELPLVAARTHRAQPAGSPVCRRPLSFRERRDRRTRSRARRTAAMQSATRRTRVRLPWRFFPRMSIGSRPHR